MIMMSQSQVLGENRNRKRESYLNNVHNRQRVRV